MKMKIIMIFVVLLFAAGIAFGENNTTDTAEIDDNTDYILPISITNEGIKFDDGFTGFCIDPSKDSISTSDKFTLGVLDGSEMENNLKLAIIECYKQGKEDAMADILSQIDDKESNNDVLSAVFDSSETIGNTAVVEIDNTTEGTFEFELLKSSDDAKSDCVAYKVSMKTIEKEDKLTASAEDTDKTEDGEQAAAGSDATNKEKSANDNADKQTANDEKSANDDTDKQTANDKKTNEDNDKKVTNEDTDKQAANNTKTTKEDNNNNDTTTQETNKTIVNKTNTVIVNENNTTVINKNNVKTINNTTEDTPQNDTVQNLLKAGNPILILIIVIAIILVAVVVMRRKD